VSYSDINATCADGSVPRAVLTRMSSAQVALILFGLVEGIVQPDIMRFKRDMRIIQFI